MTSSLAKLTASGRRHGQSTQREQSFVLLFLSLGILSTLFARYFAVTLDEPSPVSTNLSGP